MVKELEKSVSPTGQSKLRGKGAIPHAGVHPKFTQPPGVRAWTDAEIQQYRATWASGTLERLAMELLYSTGLRGGDAIRLLVKAVVGDRIGVIIPKTPSVISVPISSDLRRELNLVGPGAQYVLERRGRPISAAAFQRWFAKSIEKAEMPSECRMRGPRASAALMWLSDGATRAEIATRLGRDYSASEAKSVEIPW